VRIVGNGRLRNRDVSGLADPALPTRKKIAVLVSGQRAFDHAKFLEVCSTIVTSRSVHLRI